MRQASEELARRDPVIARLLEQVGPCALRPPLETHFDALARAILFQQLAGSAAAAIHGRFLALFDGHLTPEAVLAAPEAALRGAGLSATKLLSVRDLAAKVAAGSVPLESIEALRDDEIVLHLSQVRGIGRWTAEMFLIFQLRRADVWPVDDLGVRAGYGLAWELPELPAPKELLPLGERFRPYRTVAAWYCWRAVHLDRDARRRSRRPAAPDAGALTGEPP
jgi:DNA-3-methyladenine glycosylase II